MPADPVKTVLYVEDNAVNICLVQAIFAERRDLRFLTAINGRMGLEIAKHERPDLILLDLNLPDMDGVEFLAKLRSDPAFTAIPVIVVSADSLEDQCTRIFSIQAAAYLTKPFDIDQFECVVNRHLRI